jgi:hypothetical protein
MLTFICVLLGIAAYIAIGCAVCYLAVKVDVYDPYVEENAVFVIIFFWPILAPIVGFVFGVLRFEEYLQGVYDKNHNYE